ncbi:hypothetical protein D3C80_1458870 [compost metagenome]
MVRVQQNQIGIQPRLNGPFAAVQPEPPGRLLGQQRRHLSNRQAPQVHPFMEHQLQAALRPGDAAPGFKEAKAGIKLQLRRTGGMVGGD